MKRQRKRLFTAACAALWGLVLLPTSPAGAEEALEVMQKGKNLFQSQCLNCHQTIDEAAGGYRTRPSWQEIVKDMVGRGAKLDQDQQAAVLEYISGRMILLAKCTGCHSFIRPMTANKNLENWKSTVERMARRMPKTFGMTPEQIEKLSLYLAVERPPL